MPTVYITAPPEDANAIARTLVIERLAACVNQFPIRSTYRWDGAIETEDEVALLVKTSAETYPALRERVESLHPYDVPCIERFDEADGLEAFLQWRDDVVLEPEERS